LPAEFKVILDFATANSDTLRICRLQATAGIYFSSSYFAVHAKRRFISFDCHAHFGIFSGVLCNKLLYFSLQELPTIRKIDAGFVKR